MGKGFADEVPQPTASGTLLCIPYTIKQTAISPAHLRGKVGFQARVPSSPGSVPTIPIYWRPA